MSPPRPTKSDVTVVIPTVGRDLLRGCLESIAAGTAWPNELIVVDQSTNPLVDTWIEALRTGGLRVEHIRSQQRGIAAATNRGLERVTTPYVAVTHDDCRVRADWLERLSDRVRQIGDAVLTGRVEPEGEGLVLTIVTSTTPAVYTEPMIDRDVLFPPNMGFPLRLLNEIGYFDEHPSLRVAGEDSEWAHRALRAGIAIHYDPAVVVGHLAWQDRSQLTALHRRYARGQGSFYGKHLRRGDRLIVKRTLRDLVRAPWLVLRGALTRNRDLLAMGIGELTGLFPGILAGFRNAGNRERDPGRVR